MSCFPKAWMRGGAWILSLMLAGLIPHASTWAQVSDESSVAPSSSSPPSDTEHANLSASSNARQKPKTSNSAETDVKGAYRAYRRWARHSRISGFAQFDYLRRDISMDELSDGTGEALNENRFLIRRARLRLDSDWKWVGISGETEFFARGNVLRPVAFDVHAQIPSSEAQRPWLQLRAGLFPVPFGFENYTQTDFDRFFGERTNFAYGFVPGRFDLGIALSGHIWAIDWIVALQNGEPLGSPHFAYRDPNNAKDLSGRVRIHGQIFPWLKASFATSMLYGKGFSPGTPPTKDSFEWQDLNEDGRVLPSELIPIPGSAGRPSENFERWGMGADLQIWTDIPKLGQLMVYGEAALGLNLDRAIAIADPVLLRRDQRGFGWYAALSQEMFRYVQIGLRWEQYQPNIDSLELFGGNTVVTRRYFNTLSSGIALLYHINEQVRARFLAEYEYQRNTLGRNAQGLPDQLANDTLRLRLELVF